MRNQRGPTDSRETDAGADRLRAGDLPPAGAEETTPYDRIGAGYSRHRVPDARIARAIVAALGDAQSVVNVGAGAGSYEPRDRRVVAVEPSREMIRQRPADAAPVVQASAQELPFRDGELDAAMTLLSIHHWPDWRAGLREMRRVARRVVLFTWDPEYDVEGFWLVRDYFPDIPALDRTIFPFMREIEGVLGRVAVTVVPVPHDCTDGFLGAYWRRPELYLDADRRGAISSFGKVAGVEARIERLRDDLRTGEWERRNGGLRGLEEIDLGYRLVVGAGGPVTGR